MVKSAFLVALLVMAHWLVQTKIPTTFHIRGTVRGGASHTLLSDASVTFKSSRTITTLLTNHSGNYVADLAVGVYSMTATPPGAMKEILPIYQRLFRVTSATNVVLNANIGTGASCNLATLPGHAPPTQEDTQNICEGIELFTIPSNDGIPFQVSIQYQRRQPAEELEACRFRSTLPTICFHLARTKWCTTLRNTPSKQRTMLLFLTERRKSTAQPQ